MAYLASKLQVQRSIAAVLGEDEDALFPGELYTKDEKFTSIVETPAYQCLYKRYPLRFRSRNHVNLAALLRSVGLRKGDSVRFSSVLLREVPLYGHLKFCATIADRLQISLQELFPSDLYRYSRNEHRIPFSHNQIPLSTSPEATEVLARVTTANIDALRSRVVALLLKKVDMRSRDVVIRIFQGENRQAIASSLSNKATAEIGVSYASVSLIYQKTIARMQTHLRDTDVQEALEELATAERDARQADRVFI